MNDIRLHIDQDTAGVNSQEMTVGSRKGASILLRAGLMFVVMILLVGAASGISLWFSNAIQKATESLQMATNQSDISGQIAEIARLQSLARSLSLAVIAIAVLFTFGSIWVARRSILLPIRKLTNDIRQMTQARSVTSLPPITPLEQNDEIGDLSRAVSQMADWLRESYETLEKQVEERTRGLQRRRVQIEMAAQIARDIAAMRDLETLLYRSVKLIRDRFNFYHAGIFLSDQREEYAVLRAATGEAGREMLARSYKLKIGQTGLVGHVAQSGESRVASDVELDEVYFKNPLLRETQSEAALPLKVAGQVIGVLDVQSQEPAAFDEESITTLQIMADQLAIAIQNAHLLQESQESLKELETTYGRINRQAWERFISGSRVVGYVFDGVSANPILRDQEKPEKGSRGATGSPFSIPLRVRGELIGTLDVWSQDADLSDADVYQLATISNRISQILESTRLLQEAQRLAWREQQVNTIATQVRNSINLETILQNTIRELGKSLGATRVFIQVGGNLPLPETDQAGQSGEVSGGTEPAHLEPGTIEDAAALPTDQSQAAGSNGRSHSPPAAPWQGESEA